MAETKMSEAERIMNKYFVFRERLVNAGSVSPMNGIERLTLEIMVDWLVERYELIPKRRG